jgi:Peptidase family M28
MVAWPKWPARRRRLRPPPEENPASGPVRGVAAERAAALTVELAPRADVSRVRADIAALAGSPRNRRQPGSLEQARARVRDELEAAGWHVQAVPFRRRWVLGVSDAGSAASPIRRLRLYPRLDGVNLVAERPGPINTSRPTDKPRPTDSSSPADRLNPAETGRPPGLLLLAHLDSVAGSPGADDNASGVAALLECARLLALLDLSPARDGAASGSSPAAVILAVVDLEEVGRVGSATLARDSAFRRRVAMSVGLEAVGTFDDSPGSQKVGALGVVLPGLAGRVRARDRRGDFVLALHRRSTAAAAAVLARAGAALDPPLAVLGGHDPRPDGPLGRLATGLFPPLGHLDRSDHAPFWHRGVPSMMVTTTAPFRNPRYHGPGDRPDRVDPERVTALAVALAAFAAAGLVDGQE